MVTLGMLRAPLFAALMLSSLGCHRLRERGYHNRYDYVAYSEPANPSLPPWQTVAAPEWTPPAAGLGGAQAVAFAQGMHGRPYCWGGTGPDCFDCSGLTYRAWQKAGLAIPRTSQAQHDKLPEISMSALEPGDILWRPGHVGLYVGNGWAIHAPETGKTITYQPASKYRAAHRPR